jgi:hypothetical protein
MLPYASLLVECRPLPEGGVHSLGYMSHPPGQAHALIPALVLVHVATTT